MNKICPKCGEEKDVSEFYVHKWNKCGRLNYCKECVRERVRNHAHTESGKEIERVWNKTEKGKAKYKRHMQKFRKLNPLKYRAQTIANNAVRSGKLVKQPCEVCGNMKAEKHHDDYNKPLEVRWLCRKHHRLIPF